MSKTPTPNTNELPSAEEQMKILYTWGEERRYPDRPKSVPMSWLSDRMADYNHSQTLKRLNERGGLGPEEIVCNMLNKGLTYQREITIEQAMEFINKRLRARKN